MTLLTLLLLYGAAALGFFLLVDGVSYFISNTGGRGESRTLRRLFGRAPETRRETRVEAMSRDDSVNAESSLGQYIESLAAKADSSLKPRQIYIIAGIIVVAAYAALSLFASYLPWSLKLLIAAGLGLGLPIVHLRRKAAKRLARFQEQFPDALDLIVRSLRVGHPLSAALSTIGEEMPDPAGAEFAVAARQVTYGKTTAEAVTALARRIELADARFFAVAVQIHHEAGGNLAEILSGLSRIIRARFQLFRKIGALTVEGRFSAWFLSLFPVAMIFVMNGLQPGYYEKVADFALFPHIVALTFALLIVNVIAMRMMTKLEV
jgi:tight adherence protein B